jgi:hypothetical protein
MRKAKLVARDKFKFADEFLAEFVVWELPDKTTERPHGYKYRLYIGDDKGNCLVRYDNEAGKGDHKHIGNNERFYQFIDIDTLFKDFELDCYQALKKYRRENE